MAKITKPLPGQEQAAAAQSKAPSPAMERAQTEPDDFESAFDETEAGGSIKAGKYSMLIKSMVLQDFDPEKGQSVRTTFVVCNGDQAGTEVPQWSKIMNADKTVNKKSVEIFKKGMAILGYTTVKFGDLESICEQVTEEHPAVVCSVRINDGYTNIYMNGLIDKDVDEDVASYLEEHPFED